MFKKKPIIKTLSPLRSSDRRKTADRIIQDFELRPDSVKNVNDEPTEEDKAAHTALRKSLIPDNCLSAKVSTTSGPNLKEINGTVYVGSYGSSGATETSSSKGDQRVLWVKIDEKLYPSVYTLWRNPRLIPLLHTPSFVVDKMKGGADLMTPGLAGPPFPTGAAKGAIVAIASLEKPSVPVAVGTCAIDINKLVTTQGSKGHAVETFHWAGDELWDWSTSGRSGTNPPDEIRQWIEDDSHGELLAATERLGMEGEVDEGDEGGVNLVGLGKSNEPNSKRNPHVEGEDAIAEVVDEKRGGGMTTKEIDDTFLRAFLYGVYEQKRSRRDEHKFGLDFPLDQSFFMSHLVLPYLPTFSAEQAQALQMKKTSWKNARKFIKSLDKTKMLLCKEQKNDASVLDIDFEDHHFADFKPYRLPKKESNGASNDSALSSNDDDDSVGQQLKVINLYRPKDSLSLIFKISGAPKLSWYSASDIRSAVTAYIDSSDLAMPTNKRTIKLDPIISNAILNQDSTLDRELLAKGTIPREVLIERVISLCTPFHSILRNGETLETTKTKPKAGPAPKVGILLETRGGNKTVTRVFGLEPFFISPQALADELRKACASSTSVEPFKGGKGMEVMVQGPQKEAVAKALDKRGMAKAWVEVNDKTKGKK